MERKLIDLTGEKFGSKKNWEQICKERKYIKK